MTSENIEKLRRMILSQMETIMDLYGDEMKGSDLEFSMKVAIKSIREGGEDNFTAELNQPERIQDNYHAHDEQTFTDEDEVDEWNNEPRIPEGFRDEQHYETFLQQQVGMTPTVDDEFGDETPVKPDDVVGLIQTEDGGFTETGSLHESLATVTEMLDAQNTIYDDETGEELYRNQTPTVEEIRVSLTRAGEQELTTQQVLMNVLGSPISKTMIDVFGDNYRVEDGLTPSEKRLVFNINNDNNVSRRATQALVHGGGLAAFGGRAVIPGVGMVTSRIMVM